MKPQITLVASAIRTQYWKQFMLSLEGNKCKYEVIFVGPNPPKCFLGSAFRWIRSDEDPALCYEIGFRASTGTLVGYTADDARYSLGALDMIWNDWLSLEFRELKTVYAMTLFEDYGGGFQDNTAGQKLGIWPGAPLMAPFGFIEKSWLKKLGGIDRNFTYGQWENDLLMRAYQDKGVLKIMPPRCSVWVDHQKCHDGNKGSDFSKEGFNVGRKHLEKCWIRFGVVTRKRRIPFEPFTEEEAGKWSA